MGGVGTEWQGIFLHFLHAWCPRFNPHRCDDDNKDAIESKCYFLGGKRR